MATANTAWISQKDKLIPTKRVILGISWILQMERSNGGMLSSCCPSKILFPTKIQLHPKKFAFLQSFNHGNTFVVCLYSKVQNETFEQFLNTVLRYIKVGNLWREEQIKAFKSLRSLWLQHFFQRSLQRLTK